MKRRTTYSNTVAAAAITGLKERYRKSGRRTAARFLICLVVFVVRTVSPLTFAGDGSEKASEAKPTISILAIGNSFTKNATNHLPAIVEASPGHELTLKLAVIGGGPLHRHWEAVEAYEADPGDRRGRIYGNRSLAQLLAARSWDYVTIQQNSMLSSDVTSYRPHADRLAAYIRRHAPGSELVIHQTWAYRADDPRFRGRDSQQQMYRDLTKAYVTIANELEVKKIIPVGRAFQAARSHPDWQFVFPDPDFDYGKPVYPNLPDQRHSLTIGWRWMPARRKGKPENRLLRLDGHHANTHGQYLAAAVWFGFFFGADVRGNAFVPDRADAEDIAFLQSVAHEATASGERLKPEKAP